MRKIKVLVIGDIVIDHYPDSRNSYIGGSAANVALAFKRNSLKSDVDLIGIIGDDFAGEQLYTKLRAKGINLDKIMKLSGKTARANWRRKDSGTELISIDKGVDQGIPLDYLTGINIGKYDLVHATPYSLGLKEIKYLKANSKSFSFDASFIFGTDDIVELMPETDWFFISGGLAREHQWISKLDFLPAEGLILLNGEEGVKFFNSNLEMDEISTKNRDEIYDDLGAGDIFIGKLLSDYYRNSRDKNMKNLLGKAIKAAGKACQNEGASNLSLV